MRAEGSGPVQDTGARNEEKDFGAIFLTHEILRECYTSRSSSSICVCIIVLEVLSSCRSRSSSSICVCISVGSALQRPRLEICIAQCMRYKVHVTNSWQLSRTCPVLMLLVLCMGWRCDAVRQISREFGRETMHMMHES